jgi:hypothetical protein
MNINYFEHKDYTNYSKLISLLIIESKDISNILILFNEKELEIVERINDQYQGFDRKNNKFIVTSIGFDINHKGGIIPYIEYLNQEKIKKERKLKQDKFISSLKWFIPILFGIIGLYLTYLAIPKENKVNKKEQIQKKYETQNGNIDSELDSTLTTDSINKLN